MFSLLVLKKMVVDFWPIILAVVCFLVGYYCGELRVAAIASEAGVGFWHINDYGLTVFRFYGQVYR